MHPVVPYELLALIMIIRGRRRGSTRAMEVLAYLLLSKVLQAHQELTMLVVRVRSLQGLCEEVRYIRICTYVTHREKTLIAVVTNSKPPDLEMLRSL